jgi:hypothetical protein
VTRRLDYIKNLGCNALWISPIFKNRQERVDTITAMAYRTSSHRPSLRKPEDLKRLVKEPIAEGSMSYWILSSTTPETTGPIWAEEKAYRKHLPPQLRILEKEGGNSWQR